MLRFSKISEKVFNNIYVLMTILLILWGTFAAVSKMSLHSLDSLQAQFYLFGFAFICMTGICIRNGKFKELRRLQRKEVIRLIGYSIPSFLYYVFYLMSLQLIPAVEASMLNYSFPIMIVIFSILINGEKLDKLKVLSLLLGFFGVIVILTDGNFANIKLSNLKGDFLALSAAICWGIFSILGKKNNVDTFLSNYIYTTVSFLLTACCMIYYSNFVLPNVHAFFGLLWLSLSNIVFSYFLWFRALKVADSVLVANISFITPFLTLFFIMIFLGESIHFIQIIGLIIILAGTALEPIKSKLSKKKLNRRNHEPNHIS
jgi:drug/metabolite transporter (DMT)-like permease